MGPLCSCRRFWRQAARSHLRPASALAHQGEESPPERDVLGFVSAMKRTKAIERFFLGKPAGHCPSPRGSTSPDSTNSAISRVFHTRVCCRASSLPLQPAASTPPSVEHDSGKHPLRGLPLSAWRSAWAICSSESFERFIGAVLSCARPPKAPLYSKFLPVVVCGGDVTESGTFMSRRRGPVDKATASGGCSCCLSPTGESKER